MNKAAKKPRRVEAAAPAAISESRRRWLLIVAFFAAAIGTWAAFEFVVWNHVPTALVGKWVVTSGPQEGATFEFFRGGRLIAHVNQAGNLAVVDARIRVQGETIYSKTQHPVTGESTTTVQTIRSLTQTDLTVEDSQGKKLFMRRVE
jgi:uncharacterized protein (TIGR03066 family)